MDFVLCAALRHRDSSSQCLLIAKLESSLQLLQFSNSTIIVNVVFSPSFHVFIVIVA
jgi:hypothetical protein